MYFNIKNYLNQTNKLKYFLILITTNAIIQEANNFLSNCI